MEHDDGEELLNINLSSEDVGLQDGGNLSDHELEQDGLGTLNQSSQDLLFLSQLFKVVKVTLHY